MHMQTSHITPLECAALWRSHACYVFNTEPPCVHINFSIHMADAMRTNIVIDDKLMADALKATGLDTKKDAVEEGLKLLVRQNKQQAIRKLRVKIKWECDLNEMRGGGK